MDEIKQRFATNDLRKALFEAKDFLIMITNERQFRISKSQYVKLQAAIADFDKQNAVKRTGSSTLAQAELAALQSQAGELSSELREYERLKSGAVTKLKARSLAELPRLLIRARISQGWSQRELAEKLGLKEQQIQRYEAEEYSSASLQRLQEVADALNLNITQAAEFKESAPTGVV